MEPVVECSKKKVVLKIQTLVLGLKAASQTYRYRCEEEKRRISKPTWSFGNT